MKYLIYIFLLLFITINSFAQDNQITSYEYWFNYNYDSRISESVDESSIFNLSTDITTDLLNPGFNIFSIRFKDSNGLWSSVQTHYFVKNSNSLVEYEYWFDDSYDEKVTGELSGEAVENFEMNFDLQGNQLGFNYFHIRFKEASGLWSSVQTIETAPPLADFFIMQDGDFITLNNTSWLATDFTWDFGDGSQSNQVNPSHTFTYPGEFNVCLIAENNAGSDTLCEYVTIRGIASILPEKAGNAGYVTIEIEGGGLTENTIVSLSNESNSINTDTTFISEPGRLHSKFNLTSHEIGLYDVRIEIPQDTTYIIEDGFTVEEAVEPEFWADISGRNNVLVNRWQTYTVNYGNHGNNEMYSSIVWIAITDYEDFELEFVSRDITTPLEGGYDWTAIQDSIPLYFQIDSLGEEPFQARVYPIIIPTVGANETGSFTFRVKSPDDFNLTYWINQDWYFDADRFSSYDRCIAWAMTTALGTGLVELLASQIPGAACVSGIASQIATYDYANASLGSGTWALTQAAISCALELPFFKAYQLVGSIYSLAANIHSAYSADQDCKKKFPRKKQKSKSVKTVFSFDPNEIVGPEGFADLNYNFDNISYSYQIFFENLDDATAPAQEVFIYDTLDTDVYDLSTFALGNIGFGDTIIYIEQGLKSLSKDIDLRPEKDLILRINADLEEETGALQWTFISFDPETMDLTEDPFGGFLPPNVNSPEGEGYVSFTIKLNEDLPHGTLIENQAEIVFDLNESIVTNTWTNAIDREAPISSVEPLSAEVYDTVFMVSWSGIDEHSGIELYSVYYSVNDGEPELWKYNTNHLNDLFVGEIGNTYSFYCIATDSIGNEEIWDDIYQTSTFVTTSSIQSENLSNKIEMFPNPVENVINILYSNLNTDVINIVITDVQGREVINLNSCIIEKSGDGFMQIDASELDSGTYFIVIDDNSSKFARKFVVLP